MNQLLWLAAGGFLVYKGFKYLRTTRVLKNLELSVNQFRVTPGWPSSKLDISFAVDNKDAASVTLNNINVSVYLENTLITDINTQPNTTIAANDVTILPTISITKENFSLLGNVMDLVQNGTLYIRGTITANNQNFPVDISKKIG